MINKFYILTYISIFGHFFDVIGFVNFIVYYLCLVYTGGVLTYSRSLQFSDAHPVVNIHILTKLKQWRSHSFPVGQDLIDFLNLQFERKRVGETQRVLCRNRHRVSYVCSELITLQGKTYRISASFRVAWNPLSNQLFILSIHCNLCLPPDLLLSPRLTMIVVFKPSFIHIWP